MKRIETHDPVLDGDPVKYLWDLRVFAVSLLQNRDYAVWERMIVLGLFCKKLQELVENGPVDDIPGLIVHYRDLIEEGVSLKKGLGSIESKHSIQMELLKEIADKRYSNGITSRRYLKCLSEFLNGIRYTRESTVEEIGKRYNEAYREHYEPFMGEHEYIMENYLVNHVYKNLFPFNDEKSLFDSYMMMVLHFALIKMHLIGMGAYHKGLTLELVIELIQSLAKTVEHNQRYLDEIAGLMRGNGYNTIGFMAILIKN